VCGYIHEGENPPDTCPVCGVSAREFEAAAPEEAPDNEAPGPGKAWRCRVCGYIHQGDSPPDECPVCGAPAGEFEEVAAAEQPAEAAPAAAKKPIVIVGAGIAGISAAEAARETAPDANIILISDEQDSPYYRLNLTRYLAGEVPDDDLRIHPSEWYSEQRIDLRLGQQLEEIHPERKRILLGSGETIAYGKLVVATGAHPFMPQIPGSDLPHVHTLRTAGDAKTILAALKEGDQVVCIGGGILGLETAGALARHGAVVTVLEAFDHLMPAQLNAQGSDVLAEFLYTLGIDVLTGAQVEEIGSKTVDLSDGSTLPADMVLVTVGVRANTGNLAEAGLPVHRGVLVDNFMRTSNPDILAAGDVCEHDGVLYGSWAAAQYQGRIAGMNAAGKPTQFGGIPRSHLLKVVGKKMFSIGAIASPDGSYTPVDEQDGENYRMFMLHDGVLVGALLIGDIKLMSACTKAIENRTQLDARSTAAQIAEALKSN
jgi:nitrite reductase (NADH) large subunit